MRTLFPHLRTGVKTRFRNSWSALLQLADHGIKQNPARCEDIRQQMMLEMGELGQKRFPATARRLQYAPDIQGLWYARSDLMHVMASLHGEVQAREKILELSRLFDGLLPKALLRQGATRLSRGVESASEARRRLF